MSTRRVGIALLVLIVALVACGRAAPTSSSSPAAPHSPSAVSTPLTIPGPTLPPGEIGIEYTPVTIQAKGGKEPFLWTVSDGSLPEGITISHDGVMSGTPTVAGTSMFTLEVTDASMATANVAVSITIAPRLTLSLLRSGMTAMRQGSNATGPFGSLVGGVAPFDYSITSGSLPGGVRLDGLTLTGTFASTGTFRFTLKVTDALGAAASISPSYYIWGRIAFPPLPDLGVVTADQRWHYSDALCYGSTISGCSTKFGYAGGTPGTTPTVAYSVEQGYGPWAPPGALQGLSVSVSNGEVHLTVAPNANPNAAGQWKVYVTLTDPQTHETTSRPAEFLVQFLYYAPTSPTP